MCEGMYFYVDRAGPHILKRDWNTILNIAAFYKNVMFLQAFKKLPQSVQQKVERYR